MQSLQKSYGLRASKITGTTHITESSHYTKPGRIAERITPNLLIYYECWTKI
jgi:hypothetical protein